MVDLDVLRKKGITPERLKELFTTKVPYPFGTGTVTSFDDKVARLAYRVRTRVQDGTMNNFRNYKSFAAIDHSWNVPFRQISPTLMQSLAEVDFNANVEKAAKEWNLTHLIVDEIDEKTQKKTGRKRLDLPSFFNVFVPLVRAYVTIRAAKLTSDRNLVPYFKYDPVHSIPLNRLRCEVITDRVEAMTAQLGYRDIGRQSILKMLMYATQLMFLQEEWWKDEAEQEDGSIKLMREGLRYHLPHPTRTYYDLSHPLSSLNSDTGCEWAGYWRVRRFGDVRENSGLWNVDKIAFNSQDLRSENAVFFNSVYGSCTLQWPQTTSRWQEMDRETSMSRHFYTSDFDDSAVILTEHFEKVNPKREGLGDYDHLVWFRFVTGGDGTILYAAPLPACPVVAWAYDPDESRHPNASLALEVLPFQDQVSNLLTQALLSVRQNLANLTFVDSDIVDEEALKKLENHGESWFRKLNFFRFSGRKTRNQQQDVKYAFGSVRFPQLDVAQTLNTINAILNILERVLVMSAQEVAGQATHEQSAEEIQNIRQSTSTRLQYTSMQVDRAWDAWKRQLYAYLMAYGSESIYAQISNDPQYTPDVLAALGFTLVAPANGIHGKHQVSGPTSALQLEYFSATRDGNDRVNNLTLATAMVQMLQAALSQPMLAQVIGPEQSVLLVNQILEQMGLPRDFRLRPVPPQVAPDQIQQWVQAQLVELTKQVKQFVGQSQQQAVQEFSNEIKPLADMVKKAMAESKDNSITIAKIVDLLKTPPKALPPPANAPSPAQPTLSIGERVAA